MQIVTPHIHMQMCTCMVPFSLPPPPPIEYPRKDEQLKNVYIYVHAKKEAISDAYVCIKTQNIYPCIHRHMHRYRHTYIRTYRQIMHAWIHTYIPTYGQTDRQTDK